MISKCWVTLFIHFYICCLVHCFAVVHNRLAQVSALIQLSDTQVSSAHTMLVAHEDFEIQFHHANGLITPLPHLQAIGLIRLTIQRMGLNLNFGRCRQVMPYHRALKFRFSPKFSWVAGSFFSFCAPQRKAVNTPPPLLILGFLAVIYSVGGAHKFVLLVLGI